MTLTNRRNESFKANRGSGFKQYIGCCLCLLSVGLTIFTYKVVDIANKEEPYDHLDYYL